MDEKKYEYIKSLRLAGYLMLHGFRILRINHNLKVKNKDIYVFEQSENLEKCILKYIEKKEQRRYVCYYQKRQK